MKALTGAQVMAMAEDVPALQALKPGGKEHPIDKVLHDGDTVIARRRDAGGAPHGRPYPRLHHMDHERAGRRRGSTTSSSDAACARRMSSRLRSRRNSRIRSRSCAQLPCDVPLGDHPAQYGMQEKFAKLKAGAPNPFIDAAGCHPRS